MDVREVELPEGCSAMDKELSRHSGSLGSNLDIPKIFSAPILLGTQPRALSLSLSQCLLSLA